MRRTRNHDTRTLRLARDRSDAHYVGEKVAGRGAKGALLAVAPVAVVVTVLLLAPGLAVHHRRQAVCAGRRSPGW